MPTIHPTAVISADAALADDVVIGPYVIIEGPVEIGPGTTVGAGSFLQGHTKIGRNCTIGPAAYLGTDGQHQTYDRSQPTWLVVGDHVVIRETATLHRATRPGIDNATRVGDHVLVMASGHVGHDSVVGEHAVLAHGSMLGGHVTIGPRAFLGGGCGIHQYCRVGRLAVVNGAEGVTRDVPPFGCCQYDALKGYNATGCERSGMSRETVRAVRKAYHCYHTHRTRPAAISAIREHCPPLPEIEEIVTFLQTTRRGIQPSLRFVHEGPITEGSAD